MPKCFTFIILFLICFMSNVQAQKMYSYNAQLIDQKTNKTIINQPVLTEENIQNLTTDSNGSLKFNSLYPKITGFIDAYTSFTLLPSENTISVYVKHKAIEQEEIIVTSLQGTINTRKNTGSIVSIKQNNLFNNGGSNAFDVLNKQSGVSLITQGPAISKISIRGLSHNRVGIIQDGMKLENQQWGDDHGIDINDLNLDKIEVIKWPTSLLYGSDAMGGVVNFITKQNRQINSVQGNVSTNYNSNNQYLSNHINLNANINGYIIGAWGNIKRAQDFQNKYDGYVLNSRFQENNFGAFFNIEKKWGYINTSFNHYDKKLGLIEGERNDKGKFIYKENDAEIVATDAISKTYNMNIFPQAWITQKNAALKSKYIFNDKQSLAFSFNWQQNNRNEMIANNDTALHLNLHTFNYNLIYTQQYTNFKNYFGLIGTYQNNNIGGKEHLIPKYTTNEFAGVYLNEWNVNDKLFLAFGLRGDFRQLQNTALVISNDEENKEHFKALNKNYFNWSGNIGLAYKINEQLNFKSNVSKGFRFPHVVELLSNGAHEGTNRFEIGTNGLVPEENYQMDMSLAFENEHFLIKGEAFMNYIFNYIYLRKQLNADGSDRIINNEGSDLQVFQYEQNKAFITGIEIESDIHPHPIDWLHWGNKFSYIIGRFAEEIDKSKNLPRMMAPTWISELKADINLKNHLVRNIFINIESVYNLNQNDYFKGYNTETFNPAYWLLNSGVGAKLVYKHTTICNVFIGVNNILDEAYQNHLNTLKYKPQNQATLRNGIFEMGRNVVFKINIPIEYKW